MSGAAAGRKTLEVRGEKVETKEVTRATGDAGRLCDSDEKLGLIKLQKAFAGK